MTGRSSVPSEQRVFSLVLALVVSPEGLTKQNLLRSVYGYAGRSQGGTASGALDRQFERDKEQLRRLGIQIETLDSPSEPGNNQFTRYRISKELLEFPPELRFSERELVLLRLAALAWQEGSLSAESRRATMKLEALGAGLDVQHLGVAPQLGTVEPAAAALQSAIAEGRVVRFGYTLPGRDAPLERRVAPLRLHRAEGRWHLLSWDLERAAERSFLLARIAGQVTVEATSFDPALRDRAEGAVADLLRHGAAQPATVRVTPGSIAEARLAPRAHPAAAAVTEPGSTRELTLGMLDPHLLAAELIGFGADVAVVAPAVLRELVSSGLERIAAAHRPAPVSAPPTSDAEGSADA